MEVHHHPHVEKKNFKEYFLEFLMIFLAVTMGFFAESLREHLVNNEKEKHYAERLSDDLKKDTVRINYLLAMQEVLLAKMDAAMLIDISKMNEPPVQDLFYKNFVYFYSWVPVLHRTESTITQLKSAGGFNVMRNQFIVDSISDLDNYYDVIKYNNDWYIKSCESVIAAANQFIIVHKMPEEFSDSAFAILPPSAKVFSVYDPRLMVQLCNTIKVQRSMLDLIIKLEKKYKIKSISLLGFLEKEYSLKE